MAGGGDRDKFRESFDDAEDDGDAPVSQDCLQIGGAERLPALAGQAARLPFFTRDLDDDREQREKDHDDDHHVNSLLDVGDHHAEKIAGQGRRHDPKNSPANVVRDESAVLHAADAGDHRSESSDDRNEAGDKNGKAAVLLVKFFGAQKVLAMKKERILARENLRTGARADRVADRVADDGGKADDDVERPDVQGAAGGEDARRDEKGISRQKKADEKPGFREYDDGDRRKTAHADQRLNVVDLVEEIPEKVHLEKPERGCGFFWMSHVKGSNVNHIRGQVKGGNKNEVKASGAME